MIGHYQPREWPDTDIFGRAYSRNTHTERGIGQGCFVMVPAHAPPVVVEQILDRLRVAPEPGDVTQVDDEDGDDEGD